MTRNLIALLALLLASAAPAATWRIEATITIEEVPTSPTTPTPTPTPTPIPSSEPSMPEPDPQRIERFQGLRDVPVATDAELTAAVRSARAGDRIILAPGEYASVKGDYLQAGTLDHPVIFQGTPGAVITDEFRLVGAPYVAIYDLELRCRLMLNHGTHHVDVAGCTIDRRAAKNDAIYISNQTQGGFRFVGNRLVGNGRDGIGIFFERGRAVGSDVLIADNRISGFEDGLSLGSIQYNEHVSNNVRIIGNVIWDCRDDAIEADGAHSNMLIEGNTLGGLDSRLTAGISLAPGGPGPIIIRGNHITNAGQLPVKFNTEVDRAWTEDVLIEGNVMVTTTSTLLLYMPPPVERLQGVRFVGNVFSGIGTLLVTEKGVDMRAHGISFAGNTWLSTRQQGIYNTSGERCFLWVIFDPPLNRDGLQYLTEWEAFASYTAGGGRFGGAKLTPVAISGVSITEACRWIVDEEAAQDDV